MEGKCNKAPTSKYLDHVYCHTTQTKSVYSNNMATANNSGGGSSSTNSDVLALLKENKQLKGMLILHLDLIQEQSDQLMALRARNNALENTIQELQKQLQQQKRAGEMSTLPLPPLAKIQSGVGGNVTAMTQSANSKTTSSGSQGVSNIIGVCNGKLINKIVLSSVRDKQRTHSPQSQTTDTEHEDDDEEEREPYDDVDIEEIMDDEENEEDRSLNGQDNVENEDDREGAANDNNTKDDMSNIQQQIIDEMYDTGNSTEDSNEVLAVQSKRLRLKQAAKQSLALPRGAKPSVSPASTTTSDGQTTFKAVTSINTGHISVSRGKQMTIMRWHAPDYHTDESVSCDSTAETEKRSVSVTSCSPPKPSAAGTNDKKRYNHGHDSQHSHARAKIRKCSYISTQQLYSTREWEDEPFHFDYDSEVIKMSETEKLEIPKWTEHDLTPSYCIEGTEDLSDDTFFKRHAKFEVDEKRRKKWDVQQIREQRRIERLKRRHCKDEIQNVQESAFLQSFYPTTENLQTICYVQDLPVQAFGEMIPKIMGANGDRKDFLLPWLDRTHITQNSSDNSSKKPTVTTLSCSADTNTSSQIQNQLLNSSFVMLKKRRQRQQSTTFGTSSHHSTTRQRSSAAAKLAITTSSVPPISSPAIVTTCGPSSAASDVTITTQCTSNSNSKT